MATKLELMGFDTYLEQIRALRDDALPICKATVYPGAAILAQKMREETEALPTITNRQARQNYRDGTINTALSEGQKAGLLEGLGITPISRQQGGIIQCSVGFAGYNGVKTKHFPGGQPNAEVARSLEKGTSYLKRNAFVARAVRKARSEAIEAMRAEADAQIERIMNEHSE